MDEMLLHEKLFRHLVSNGIIDNNSKRMVNWKNHLVIGFVLVKNMIWINLLLMK